MRPSHSKPDLDTSRWSFGTDDGWWISSSHQMQHSPNSCNTTYSKYCACHQATKSSLTVRTKIFWLPHNVFPYRLKSSSPMWITHFRRCETPPKWHFLQLSLTELERTKLSHQYSIGFGGRQLTHHTALNLGQSTGWVETNPLVLWYQWDYLCSPAKNL